MSKRQTFKLIILDFALPDAHGYAGMLRVQQIDPDVPIVIVIAREDLALVQAAKALGAVGFLCQSASKKDPLSACKRDPLRRAA